MNINKLAWRNLWRRKRRTFITASSIAFGLFLALTFTGAGDYFYTRMIDAGASMGMGHVTVQAPDYHRAPNLKKRINNIQQRREAILSMPEVADATNRINGHAMFASSRKQIAGAFIAIDTAQENADNNLFIRTIVKGKMFDQKNKRGIVIGIKLAQKLNLKLGKKLVYTTTDVHGEIVSALARVTGIFETGVPDVDSSMALLPINSVQKTIGYTGDEATLLAIIIKDQRQAQKVRAQIASMPSFNNTQVLSWRESQPELAGMINTDKSGNYISQFFIAILVTAGILNTMLMSVLERKHEFGIVLALGMSPAELFKLVMLEAFWLAVVGLLVGLVVCIPWYFYMYHIGIDLSGAYGENFDFGGVLIDPILKLRLFSESVFTILAGLFSLALLAGAYPAWKAGRTVPVDSIKTV